MIDSRHPRALLVCAALALAALGGCASEAPDAPLLKTDTSQATQSNYVIGAGDVLGIFVYHSPDLSVASLPVRPDGRISLPLIPDIEASGRTPTQLGQAIAARLKTYLRDPTVTVMVQSFVGPLDRQIRVIGAATEPLALPYRNNMTLLDVMVAAKGLSRFAAGNSARILRQERGRTISIPVKLDSLMKEGDLRDNVVVRPGDTLVIPQSWF